MSLWLYGVMLGSVLLLSGVAGLTLHQVYRFTLRRSWRKSIRLPSLSGYVIERSLRVGAPIRVCVHALEEATAQLVRMGRSPEPVGAPLPIAPCRQSNRYDFWAGCNWQVNLEIPTDGCRSGLHLVELRSAGGKHVYRIAVLLQPATPAPLAVIASTNTWDAYNDFGGLSNYRDFGLPLLFRVVNRLFKYCNWRMNIGDRHRIPTVPLPGQRPNDAINRDLANLDPSTPQEFSHLLFAEYALLRHFEREGIEYAVYSDRDFAFHPDLDHAKCIVFNTHSEYWTAEMMGRLDRLTRQGRKVLFLSGNNMYREVEFLASGIQVIDQKLDREVTASRIGLGYDARGYASFASYRLLDSNHWSTVGVDEKPDALFCQPNGEDEGTPSYGGSGWETDKCCSQSGDVVVLARGNNSEGAAEMIFKPLPGGGWIFNTGSVASSVWVAADPVLQKIVSNLVTEALSGKLPNNTPSCDTLAPRSAAA
jgi:N,N-dimethylformamidase